MQNYKLISEIYFLSQDIFHMQSIKFSLILIIFFLHTRCVLHRAASFDICIKPSTYILTFGEYAIEKVISYNANYVVTAFTGREYTTTEASHGLVSTLSIALRSLIHLFKLLPREKYRDTRTYVRHGSQLSSCYQFKTVVNI